MGMHRIALGTEWVCIAIFELLLTELLNVSHSLWPSLVTLSTVFSFACMLHCRCSIATEAHVRAKKRERTFSSHWQGSFVRCNFVVTKSQWTLSYVYVWRRLQKKEVTCTDTACECLGERRGRPSFRLLPRWRGTKSFFLGWLVHKANKRLNALSTRRRTLEAKVLTREEREGWNESFH